MIYSLLSRFQGSLCGIELAQNALGRLPPAKPHSQWYDLGEPVAIDLAVWETPIDALIQHGQFGLDELFEQWRSPSESEALPSPVGELDGWLAVTPIALFFHENEAQFRHNVKQLATALQLPSTFADGASVMGYAIARTLHNTLEPASLIPQMLHSLKLMETQPVLGEPLAIVQTLLERGASLEQARMALTRRRGSDSEPLSDRTVPLALAFYCFLSTAEDFRLSVLRSLQLQSYSPAIAAIVAALSGAYNGDLGIPREWCAATDSQTQQLGVRLYAAWSGVLDAPQILSAWGLPAVVAPRR